MEYQVRISYETAEILENLKDIYETKEGIHFSKSDVLMKAISDNRALWNDVSWKDIIVKRNKKNIVSSSLRPKFDVSKDTSNDIEYLKKILPKCLDSRSVTYGVVIKYILKIALFELQKKEPKTIREMIEFFEEKHLSKANTDEEKENIKSFAGNIINSLDKISYEK
ncbi:hypothetical protein [Liquorilactobacillus hordei]|uniref:Uncharacterized protein n=1 Tax=Liquorilactobacillus hordei DSM 19519 TaxID=1423759 RepID=A0A0R1M993_9LACO|nr:hypothetical protein [Liquorilactobacillus hordei]KRL04909.1 hypothetical protein FC92_GL001740 [Liquorilactobacillus hordei DSM 19519]QYH51635.1 hypothetical protein G6O70_03690 [Liquorilactobacillus hordei DSM 19519]